MGNYYHDNGDGVGVGYSYNLTASQVAPLYTVSGTNLTAAATNATVTHADKHYFAAGATVTLTTDGNHIISGTPTVSGTGASLGSVASDKKSMTVAVGSSDVTVTATTAWPWQGTGTSSNPYKIANYNDLLTLRNAVNVGNSFENVFFQQTANIDWPASTTWTSGIGISTDAKHFIGSYDGGGYTISGLSISANCGYAGLFGFVNTGGTVKNVCLISPSVTSGFGGAMVGALIGSANLCTVENCSVVSPTLSATTSNTDNEVGGLVGLLSNGYIQNCYVISPTVSGTGSTRVGAICGHAYSSNNDYYCTLTNVYYYDSSFETIGLHVNSGGSHVTNLGRAYTLTLGSGVTTSTTPAFSYNSVNYYYGTVTLSDLPTTAGYIFGYTVNGSPISGTSFTISADATVACTQSISSADFEQTATNEYTIHTATGWSVFCDLLAGGETFSSKTVRLGADIGTPENPITRMAGSDGHEFMGNFDGGGNTLTFTATAADNYCAPFRNVKGGSTEAAAATIGNLNVKSTITATDFRHTAGLIALQSGHVNVTGCNADVTISSTAGTNNPTDLYPAALVSQAGGGGTLTVTGCTATGTVSTDGKYAAGLVGIVQGTASITDCLCSVTINSSISGDGTHGGLVGVLDNVSGSNITITGCVFNGKLLTKGTTATNNCGGFVGWSAGTLSISHSLYAPATILEGETEVLTGNVNSHPSATFARGNTPTLTNSYYTRTLGTAQGKAPRTVTGGERVTVSGIALTGNTTSYTTSGITAYSGGLSYGNNIYYGNGDNVSLTLSHGDRTGYTFSAYTASTVTLNGNTLTMPDADVTINATWTPIPYTVHFDGNGNTGGSMSDQSFTYDATQNLTANAFSRTGYTFAGWATEANGDVVYDDQQSVSNLTATNDGSVTLYAKWTTITYNITYHPNEGTLTTDKNSFTIESEAITLDEPTLTGYAFAGWYTNSDFNGDPVTTIAQGSTGDITLYAKWLLIYTITYHPNDGTLTTDKNSFTVESPDITLDEPTRTGYAFCGWYANEELTGDAVTTIAQGSTGNMELWARWTPFYTITYHLDGGTLTTDYDGYTVESPAITLDKPTRSGYAFGGWYTNEELTGDAVTTIAQGSTDHREYWAKWIVDWAATSSGDDADHAYMIYNKDQLDLLAHRVNGTHGETRQTDGYSGKYFRLGADIEYPHTTNWIEEIAGWVDDKGDIVIDNTENNFEAIGGYLISNNNVYSYFCGDFDGDGHTVSGIRIYSEDRRKGLFGQIGEIINNQIQGNANIHDLRLADACITVAYSVGGIVGSKYGGIVTRCHVASNVVIQTVHENDKHHGGIVGFNGQGTIDHCTSAATLTADNSKCSSFGAIAGTNYGTLTDNLAIGATVPACSSGSHGAICGSNEINGTLYRNYYTACTVAGKANATGVGCHNADAGAVPGFLLSLSKGITSTALTVGDYTVAAAGQAVTLTSGTVPLGYSFAGFTVKKTADNTDVTTGVLSGNVTDGYTLTMPDYDVTVTHSLTTDPWEGEGTKDSPYIILNHNQLDLLAERVNNQSDDNDSYSQYSGKYFKLGADIEYPHTTDWDCERVEVNGDWVENNENNFVAIGNTGQGHFCGDFDGDGHTVSGIRIYNYLHDNQGLFGYIGSNANIHDLRLADARITGFNNNGGIVGYNIRGTVTRCHVASNVAIHAVNGYARYHGGIVGYNVGYQGQGGTIDHCSSAATLTKADGITINYCGAIAGQNDMGTLTDNLVIGATVPACSNYGAICGSNGGTLARNYYTACTVAGTANATGVGCPNADVTDNDGAVPALRDNADNTTAIGLFAALSADLDLGWGAGKYPVALNGRTLYKDGDWNTLCLPFEVTAEQLAETTHPLYGATIMELDVSGTYGAEQTGFDAASGTLYLYFKDATSIVAGRPYIIKWATAGDNLVNPVFSGVTIAETTNDVAFTGGSFKGTYASRTFDNDDRSILFLSSSNTLTWPKSGARIGAFRSYFDLGSNSGVREFKLYFGDGETSSIENGKLIIEDEAGAWYSLDGRKHDKVPTRKGLYIHNGRKVVIK